MGRPREHDEQTRLELIGAAEQLIQEHGPEALSVRAVADAIGVSTRAVYSTFGSKAGLLDALSGRAFHLLAVEISRLPVTNDPSADLVEAALRVFRPMAIGHPALFRLAFLRVVPDLEVSAETRATAARAFDSLCDRFRRLADAGLLGGRHPEACAAVFNALCEGMATSELRTARLFADDPEAAWRQAFSALLAGFTSRPPPMSSRRSGRRR